MRFLCIAFERCACESGCWARFDGKDRMQSSYLMRLKWCFDRKVGYFGNIKRIPLLNHEYDIGKGSPYM